MPRVAIDVRMVNHSGIGTYLRNIVPRVIALRPDWRFDLLAQDTIDVPADWTMSGNRVSVARCSSGIYSLWEQLELPLRAPRGGNLFWSPHYDFPVLTRMRVVVTVHDVAHLALPNLYSGAFRQSYARAMFAQVRRRARHVIFDSRFSSNEFSKYAGAPAGASSVVHIGVADGWFTPAAPSTSASRPYLIFVGAVKPHKNLAGALKAFEALRDTFDGDLIIVGERDQLRTVDHAALALADAMGPRVKFAGRVDDATLRQLVAGASALVFPSFYEGFGLPPLEAMAAGCPCVVSSRASLPEVCGDAALYCDPSSPSDIAAQIMRVLTDDDLRARNIERGRALARTYSWERSAAQTVDVLESTLA